MQQKFSYFYNLCCFIMFVFIIVATSMPVTPIPFLTLDTMDLFNFINLKSLCLMMSAMSLFNFSNSLKVDMFLTNFFTTIRM